MEQKRGLKTVNNKKMEYFIQTEVFALRSHKKEGSATNE